jgi:hypothetical protein
MKSSDRIHVGIIDGGSVDGAFSADLFAFGLSRSSRIDGMVRVEGNLLSRSRNRVVDYFLEQTRSPWLLMLDTDQRLPLTSLDRLIDAAHEVSVPVVSGLVFAAYLPDPGELYPKPVPTIYRRVEGRYAPIHDYPRDRLIEVDASGSGCVLIHRSALETVRDNRPDSIGPAWAWFADGPVGDDWYSEDLALMRRLEAAGIPIHAHTGALMPHLKTYTLTEAHHARYLEELAHE